MTQAEQQYNAAIAEIHELQAKVIKLTELCFDASPIPISDEWLERSGFKFGALKLMEGSSIVCHEDGFIGLKTDYPTELGMSWTEMDLPHIKYVHQLQNLYFALTGAELKIKQP